MAVTIKTTEDIALLREGGHRLAEVLAKVAAEAHPGISTYDLDKIGEALIRGAGGIPSFKGYKTKGSPKPYPASLCISVNDEIVHGIPRKQSILKEGDIVGLDIGMWWPVPPSVKTGERPAGALCTDMAITIGVGRISKEAERLLRGTKESLEAGIKAVRAGVTIGDISSTIEARLKKEKFGIIRDLAGHGVGYQLHEDPLIPNYGKPGTGIELKENMVIALEPMATLGDWRVNLADDEWTFVTADGSLGAHFEHTMVVTRNSAEVLTVA